VTITECKKYIYKILVEANENLAINITAEGNEAVNETTPHHHIPAQEVTNVVILT
jgi:hypothetical protein